MFAFKGKCAIGYLVQVFIKLMYLIEPANPVDSFLEYLGCLLSPPDSGGMPDMLSCLFLCYFGFLSVKNFSHTGQIYLMGKMHKRKRG